MSRSVETFIALRYLRPRRGQWFVSLITFASVSGIALCVAALIIIISVMNGFGNELRERLVSLTSHITVTGADGPVSDWRDLAAALEQRPEIIGLAPFAEGQGMIVNRSRLNGTIISGVLPELEPQVSVLGASMVSGSMDSLSPGSQNILLDSHLAFLVEAKVGDKLTLWIPRPNGNGSGVLPLMRRFTVSGIFNAGLQSASAARSVMHLDDAVALFDLAGNAGGVHVKLTDLMSAPPVARELANSLPDTYVIEDWTRQHASYFRALRVEKVMMSLFLLLAVGVAAFNINAMLMMVVSDKRTDIAVLRTLGLAPGGVTRIFLTQGAAIAVLGVVIGVVFGVVGALNAEAIANGVETVLGRKLFNPDVYYVSRIPSQMRWSEVTIVATASLLLALVSTLFPSRRAALIEPAEALRYE